MNVAITYFKMTKEQGMSDREAVFAICHAIGLKPQASYAIQWQKEGGRPIPPAAVIEMQKRCIHYACTIAGINTTEFKALKLANLISPKNNKRMET
ncbi:hypothetical protein [Vibrio owensii]|uniref:hypothetical protein n=1 Tax=Vibrio owensii TaxID=696485 RepID=UPI004068D61A